MSIFQTNPSEILQAYMNSITDPEGRRYAQTHLKRYKETLEWIPKGNGGTAVEIGATGLFQYVLQRAFNYSKTIGTVFSDNILEKSYVKHYEMAGDVVASRAYSIDIESEIFPEPDHSIEFILCAEVIEHLDVDPMFMISEFNRILNENGQLLITTPNSCSARNFWKMSKGYRPHFFMQYEKSRSPYRHNFEYDVHALNRLMNAGGFQIIQLGTFDVFEEPHEEAIHFLRKHNLETNHRGDDIFLLAKKVGPVLDRWPSEIYV